jgi:hypothetical protein
MLSVLVLALAAPIAIAAMLAWDALVRIEHDVAHRQWETDGRPTPMLRRSTDIPFTVPGMFASTRCCMAWILSMPPWARDNVRASRLVTRLRLLLLVWTFVAVPLFALTLFWPVVGSRVP